jgi:hypothetical protein
VKGKSNIAVAAALCLAMACLLVPCAASAASPTLYVGDAKEYSVAFKAEETQLYVMELAGRTHCYFTEPHEDLGAGGFSVFPAPKLMRSGPNGFVAEEITGEMYGGAYARVRAELSGSAVTGTFSFDESLESFHCDTGFSNTPFRASRYEPIGSAEAAAPARGEVRAYYGNEAPIEIFMRATGKEAAGIRGSFTPPCPVGKRAETPARLALFGRPVFAKLGEKNGFKRRAVHEGRMRSGGRYKETVSLTGRVERDAVAGAYLRVRTANPGRPAEQRCVTGPIPFRAARYLLAR